MALTIPLPLPTTNKIIEDAKRHWSKYSTNKRAHSTKVALLARGLSPITVASRFVFDWRPADHRTDLDNLAGMGAKVIFDGLVQAGVLPNDGPKYVVGICHTLHAPNKTSPSVTISWTAATT